MSMSKEELTHFRLDGEDLTRLVRSLWADERQQAKALKLLSAAFPEMLESQQLSILCGEMKLVGNERGMELVPDGATHSLVGNPLSIHTLLSKEEEHTQKAEERAKDLQDLDNNHTVLMGSPWGLLSVPRWRVEGWTDGIGIRRPIIRDFGPGKSIPDWETFAERVTCRISIPAGEKGKSPLVPPPGEPDIFTRRELEARAGKDKKKYSQLKAKWQASLGKGEDTPSTRPFPPKGFSTITTGVGWLSPEGKFYPCSYMEHDTTAEALGFQEIHLEKLGWVKLHLDPATILEPDKPVTQAQIDLLYDYFVKISYPLPSWVIR